MKLTDNRVTALVRPADGDMTAKRLMLSRRKA
jgi:hypothetical protein